MTKRRVNKVMVTKEMLRIGADFWHSRQTTQEGVRMFIVKYKGKINGFRSLAEILIWSNGIHTHKDTKLVTQKEV